jgi:hypothetical protein
MREPRQRPALLEEALHAVAEGWQVLVGNDRRRLRPRAQGQRVGQVFLDRDTLPLAVGSHIDDRKPAQGQLFLDAVFIELKPAGRGWFACCAIDVKAIMGSFRPLSGFLGGTVKPASDPRTPTPVRISMIYSMTGYAARTCTSKAAPCTLN